MGCPLPPKTICSKILKYQLSSAVTPPRYPILGLRFTLSKRYSIMARVGRAAPHAGLGPECLSGTGCAPRWPWPRVGLLRPTLALAQSARLGLAAPHAGLGPECSSGTGCAPRWPWPRVGLLRPTLALAQSGTGCAPRWPWPRVLTFTS